MSRLAEENILTVRWKDCSLSSQGSLKIRHGTNLLKFFARLGSLYIAKEESQAPG